MSEVKNWNSELDRLKQKQFKIYDMAANIKEQKSRKTRIDRKRDTTPISPSPLV